MIRIHRDSLEAFKKLLSALGMQTWQERKYKTSNIPVIFGLFSDESTYCFHKTVEDSVVYAFSCSNDSYLENIAKVWEKFLSEVQSERAN